MANWGTCLIAAVTVLIGYRSLPFSSVAVRSISSRNCLTLSTAILVLLSSSADIVVVNFLYNSIHSNSCLEKA